MREIVVAHLLSRISSAASAGFIEVSGLPSSEVSASLVRLDALSQDERNQYFLWVAERNASYWGFRPRDAAEPPEVLLRFLRAPIPAWGTRTRSETLASTREVRNGVNQKLRTLLNAEPRKSREPGETQYTFNCLGKTAVANVQFTGQSGSLRYAIRIPGELDGLNFNLECFYGLGLGGWNQIERGEMSAVLDRLPACIESVVREHVLVQELLAGWCSQNGT